MPIGDIPLDKAELLSMLLEGILYGFSLPMFGGTIWVLLSQRATNRKILSVACLLLLCSTVHIVIRVIRVMEAFVLLRDTFPGGPIGYFSDVSYWTFVSKNYVYAAQTLIGDAVILYRCYAVWQSKLIMILPALLWGAVVVTGIACPYAESHTTQGVVFDGSLSQWIKSFWASTLTTNLLTTFLLAYRIWYIDQKNASSLGHQKSQLRPVLYIVIDAGMVYTFTLLAALICFVNRSNAQYVILDMITPIISITFYMVIIRVGLANQANKRTSTLPGARTTTDNSVAGDRRSRVQVHVPTCDENDIDNDQHSPMSLRTLLVVKNNHRSEVKFDNAADVI